MEQTDISQNATASASKGGRLRTFVGFVLKLLVVGGILYFLYFRNNTDELSANLRGANLAWLALAAALYGFHLLAGTFRWFLLLRCQNIEITYWKTLSLNLQSLFIGMVIPGGALGGDLVKTAFITAHAPPGSKVEGVFTILIDRIFGMLGLFLVASAACVLSLHTIDSLSKNMLLVVYLLLACCVGALLAVVALWFHRTLEKIPPVRKLIALGDHYAKGSFTRLATALDLFKKNTRTLVACLLISTFAVHFLLAVVTFILGLAFHSGDNAGFGTYLLAVSVGNSLAVIPGAPSGLGVRDIGVVSLLIAGGLAADKAKSVMSFFSLFLLFFNLSGGLFFLFDKKRAAAHKRVETESDSGGETK